jgi:hypothetical protein
MKPDVLSRACNQRSQDLRSLLLQVQNCSVLCQPLTSASRRLVSAALHTTTLLPYVPDLSLLCISASACLPATTTAQLSRATTCDQRYATAAAARCYSTTTTLLHYALTEHRRRRLQQQQQALALAQTQRLQCRCRGTHSHVPRRTLSYSSCCASCSVRWLSPQ